MPHLNQGLTAQDFFDDAVVRPGDRSGFKNTPRVVTIQGPFKLFKLTGDRAPQSPRWNVVTPWWSAVDPFEEDKEGALGRFKQAYMNGIDMSSMVRYMSAVKVEWNSLSEYVEISVKRGDKIDCFWGEFAPMPLTSDLPTNQANLNQYSQTTPESARSGYSSAVLPERIGVLRAWQFFIPRLTDAFIEGGAARTIVDAHDMSALGRHFGLDLGETSDLGKVLKRIGRFYRDTRSGMYMAPSPKLKEMQDCVTKLWSLDTSPREILREFVRLGDAYVATSSKDPRPVQTKVQQYLADARAPW